MGSREDGNVHRNTQNVGFVEPNAKVPLSAQQQEDEDANVHEADTSCRLAHTDLKACVKCDGHDQERVSAHTDLLWPRSGGTGWEPERLTRHCSSAQRTRTSRIEEKAAFKLLPMQIHVRSLSELRTLLMSQSFQKRSSSSWSNWIFLVE